VYGTLFYDNGAGGGIEGDGIRNGDEAPITNSKLYLADPYTEQLIEGTEALSDSSGDFKIDAPLGNYVLRVEADPVYRYIFPSLDQIRNVSDGLNVSLNEPGKSVEVNVGLGKGFLSEFGWPCLNYYDWDPREGYVKWWNGQTFTVQKTCCTYIGNYVIEDNHTGSDFGANEGTIITARAPGTVSFKGQTNGSNWIQLGHDNGFSTSYNHISQSLVGVGQRVKRGDPIAKVGMTGTIWYHCHFELLLPQSDHLAILDPYKPVWQLDDTSSGYWGFRNGNVFWVRVPASENPNGRGYWIDQSQA
jgi:murein DD-endopeptidase MepM/ murein hydrolase activator NlpD